MEKERFINLTGHVTDAMKKKRFINLSCTSSKIYKSYLTCHINKKLSLLNFSVIFSGEYTKKTGKVYKSYLLYHIGKD